MSDNDNNVVNFMAKLSERQSDQETYFQHLDNKSAMHRILAEAVAQMGKLGEREASIASTLRFAADVLEGKEN